MSPRACGITLAHPSFYKTMSAYQILNMNHSIFLQILRTVSGVSNRLSYISQFSYTTMASNTATPYSSNYERMSGNCTRILAAQMVSTIFPPITSSSYILDNACGPGIVSEQIKLLHADARILAADIAPGMIEEVQQSMKTNGWETMETQILDVRDLSSLNDETFTHIITNLGLPVPGDLDSSPKIVNEMFRVLKIGGVALVSTWAGKTPSSR